MIAQRQRPGKRSIERLEAAEMGEPLLVAEIVQPDTPCPALVAVAQDGFGEIGRLDAIEEGVAQQFMIAGWFEAGHGLLTLAHPVQFASATQPIATLPSGLKQIDLYRTG